MLAAAQALTAGWFASVLVWRYAEPGLRPYGFAFIDMALCFVFWSMSRGRWFPVPLFFLHVVLIPYHVYTAALAAPIEWVALFLNRAFEFALAYVIACSVFRIRREGKEA